MHNIVLIVIDVQKGFLTEYSRHIIPKVLNLMRTAKNAEIPIVATRFVNHPESPYVRLMGWQKFMQPPATDLIAEVHELSNYVIDKSVYSSLTNEFLDLIKQNCWDIFLLCGIATEGCVLKTAVDLFEIGLRPIVVRDACASHDGAHYHRIGLELIERHVGAKQIVDEEVAFSVCR